MEILDIVRQTIMDFCAEFVSDPYLCYTEHGQHALFYAKLYSAIPEQLRYARLHDEKNVCIVQKEYPTATNLGKSQRQHWDIAVLSVPLHSQRVGVGDYDYLDLLAAIEFGLNEAREHLEDDIRRLDCVDSNIVQKFVVHFYRLTSPDLKFSSRDWSSKSARIVSPQDIGSFGNNSIEIYYGMADSSGTYENGVWCIKNGQVAKIQ